MKTARLICVTEENNNKFYNMTENSDGSISVERGRIGLTNVPEFYAAGKTTFERLLNSKLKKGYKDVTSLKMVNEAIHSTTDKLNGINDVEVKKLINFLLKCSKETVKENYSVSTADVTITQINKAQKLINKTTEFAKIGSNRYMLNSILLELYATIPRNMKHVKDHLMDSLSTIHDIDNLRKLIDNEQSLLSTLESQILTNTQTNNTSSKNILEEMNIEIFTETDQKMLDKINHFLGDNAKYCKNIFKVTNKNTQSRFDSFVNKSSNKTTKLLWHGSRNENWIGILQKGLMIRPSNVVITGAMFGNGIYFANRAQKSIGYSSLKGSYWTNGSESKGFIALFSVHTGNEKIIKSHDSSCGRLHEQANKGKFDSVFAVKGVDLKNDEIITYNTDQSTISYIIELNK